MRSTRLVLSLMVANVSITGPVTVARAGAQLARLFGGDRVWVGVGAGWNAPEFRALGMPMPSHRHRAEHLGEAVALLSALFGDGHASLRGRHVRAQDLPLSPLPETPPRLLVGGGSASVLDLGGRLADVVDLNAPHGRDVPGSGGGSWARDARRRLDTTVEDITRAVAVVRAVAQAAGRQPPIITVNVDTVVVCDERDVVKHEARICRRWALPPRSLADCPYTLLGEPEDVSTKLTVLQRAGVGAVAVESGVEDACAILKRSRNDP